MIKIGEKIPKSILRIKNEKIEEIITENIFLNCKTILFAVPRAFTPTCSAKHLPGYLEHYEKIIEKGVQKIICLSVNDPHVMKEWGKHNNVSNKIMMLSDSDCSFSKRIGLDHHYGAILGHRSLRFAMVIENNVLVKLFVDEVGVFKNSSAENLLLNL